jgi:hypothetical protein
LTGPSLDPPIGQADTCEADRTSTPRRGWRRAVFRTLPVLATAAAGCGVFGAFDFDGYGVEDGTQDAALTSSGCDNRGLVQQYILRNPTVSKQTSGQPAACDWVNGQGALALGDQSYASLSATEQCAGTTPYLLLKGFGLQLPSDATGVSVGIEAMVRAVGGDGTLTWQIGIDQRMSGTGVPCSVQSSGGAWQLVTQQGGVAGWGIKLDSETGGLAAFFNDPEFVVMVTGSAAGWGSTVEMDIDSVQVMVSYDLHCGADSSLDDLDASTGTDASRSDRAAPEG